MAEVHAATDFEPPAIARDAAVADALRGDGIGWRSWVDQVVFGPDQVRTADGRWAAGNAFPEQGGATYAVAERTLSRVVKRGRHGLVAHL